MKVIGFISAFPPNNRTAGQQFTKQLVEEIAEKYEVKLLYFDYPNHEIKLNSQKNINIIKLKLNLINKIFDSLILFFVHPLFSNRFDPFKINLIRKELEDCDILIFNFSQVFLYAFLFPAHKKVLIIHDVIHQKYSRKTGLLGLFLSKLAYYSEKFIFEKLNNTTLVCLNEKDRLYIKETYKKDAAVIYPYINEYILKLDYKNIEVTNSFCFFGAWNRPENAEGLEWFVDNVIHLLPNSVNFLVIGPNLPERLKNKLQRFSNVKILGFIDNPYPMIAQSKGLIAPIFQGAGIKVKVIESLACGTPIIGTEIAFEGINFDFNSDKIAGVTLLAKTPKDYIKHINMLMNLDKTTKEQIRNQFLFFYNKISRKFSEILDNMFKV